MVAVEREATGGGHVEAGVHVADRGVERHGHTVDRVDQRLEGAEVDLDVVVVEQAEVLPDRVGQLLGIATLVGLVDPATA